MPIKEWSEKVYTTENDPNTNENRANRHFDLLTRDLPKDTNDFKGLALDWDFPSESTEETVLRGGIRVHKEDFINRMEDGSFGLYSKDGELREKLEPPIARRILEFLQDKRSRMSLLHEYQIIDDIKRQHAGDESNEKPQIYDGANDPSWL